MLDFAHCFHYLQVEKTLVFALMNVKVEVLNILSHMLSVMLDCYVISVMLGAASILSCSIEYACEYI